MTIKGLNKLISEIVREREIENVTTAAVDAEGVFRETFAIAALETIRDMNPSIYHDQLDRKILMKHWIKGVLAKTRLGIKLIFVIDGKAPPEKADTRSERQAARDKLRKSIDDLRALIKTLTPFDDNYQSSIEAYNKKLAQITVYTMAEKEIMIEYLVIAGQDVVLADCEAEKYCSYLCYHGFVDAVYSADSDCVAYNAPIMIRKLSRGKILGIYAEDVRNALNLGERELLDFCILCGCDYNKNMYKVGPAGSLKLIKEHGSLERIQEVLGEEKMRSLNWMRTREIFLSPCNGSKFTSSFGGSAGNFLESKGYDPVYKPVYHYIEDC